MHLFWDVPLSEKVTLLFRSTEVVGRVFWTSVVCVCVICILAGEQSIEKRSGHPKSLNPSSEMTAVGLHSSFPTTLSKLVKVDMASSFGLWRMMTFYSVKLLMGPYRPAPSGEPSLLHYREIYPLWPTVKLPLKPLLIQIWFSSRWLQRQWGKRLRCDKLATCIFYELLEKSWISFILMFFCFLLGEMSFETPQFLSLYSVSSSNLKASLHSRRLPCEEACWRKLPLVCGQRRDCQVKWHILPTTGEISSFRTRGLISIPQRPQRALRSNGLHVGQCGHPVTLTMAGSIGRSCSSLCQDPKLLLVSLFRYRAGD